MSVVRVTAADNQSADVQDFNHGGGGSMFPCRRSTHSV